MAKKVKLKKPSATACYPGSLLQQSFGESIDKGYVIWDTNEKEYQRRFILNDYGFSKIRISHGESIEDRVNNMKFSHDKRKTKVHVVIQDFEENYSLEKEQQIKQLIRDKHGCESINISFEEIKKDKQGKIEVEGGDYEDSDFRDLLLEFINKTSPNTSKEEIEDTMKLSDEIDSELNISREKRQVKNWSIDSMEVSNIYSFPEKSYLIDFAKYDGVLGIFGENFSGKSNLVRALIFGLFQVELGKKGRSAGNLINIYTKSNNGYVTIHLTINGEKYKIHREVKSTIDKTGKLSNSFPVKYYKYLLNSKTNTYFWKEEESDENTTENKEIKRQIIDAIGSFDEFSKISLHLQSGEGDFMKEEQQPKNDLIRKFMGLDLFDERYEYANETFKEIKKKQKDLGDLINVTTDIKNLSRDISIMSSNLNSLSNDKASIEDRIKSLEEKKKTHQSGIQNLDYVEINDISKIEEEITNENINISSESSEVELINNWLSVNFKKGVPQDAYGNINNVNESINKISKSFQVEKDEYISLEKWIKSNSKFIIVVDHKQINSEISNLNSSLISYNNQLSISRGESCPTCGSVTRQANQELIDNYTSLINSTNEEIARLGVELDDFFKQQNHNNQYDLNSQRLEVLRQSLINKKSSIDELKKKKSVIESCADLLAHNLSVENKTERLKFLGGSILSRNQRIIELDSMKNKIIINQQRELINSQNREKIKELEDEIYQDKVTLRSITNQENSITVEKLLAEEKLKTLNDRLSKIMDSERQYKKYSLYLQAVHRDGIPADIIRKKLPIINSKINSLLGEVVDFRVEIIVNKNGDLIEYFYFNDDKSDMLPVYAFSGSQGFLSALAVKVALQYASNFVKPSMLIIDEGFGTLDKNIIHEFPRILDYLRPKFRNILITTHISEVKDFVDHLVEISKTRVGVTKDGFDKHPKAWVTHVSLS